MVEKDLWRSLAGRPTFSVFLVFVSARNPTVLDFDVEQQQHRRERRRHAATVKCDVVGTNEYQDFSNPQQEQQQQQEE